MPYGANDLAATCDGDGLRLAVLAHRSLMAQFSGDAQASARLWQNVEAVAPPGEACVLYGDFFAFARALLTTADRPLEWRCNDCPHLCRDEWLAVSMIDAAQRGNPAALLAAAAELVGAEALGDAMNAAQALGFAMARRGIYTNRPRH